MMRQESISSVKSSLHLLIFQPTSDARENATMPSSPSPSPPPPKKNKSLLVILCSFCFFFWFKPSEPFLVPYLVHTKGFSIREINEEIFPVYVYAFFAWTLLSGPIAARYGSRFMLRVGVLSEFVVRWVLIYGESIHAMRFMQVCFGATIASFPFAFSYGVEIFSSATNTELEEEDFEDDDVSDTIDNNNNTYHCDEKKENEKHNGDQTGYISATFATSYAFAGIVGQLAVSFGNRPAKAEDRIAELFWVSLTSVGLAVLVAFFVLPDVSGRKSQRERNFSERRGSDGRFSAIGETVETMRLAYSELGTRCLSIYWVVASAGLNFVQTYGSNSWYETDADSGVDNGYFVFIAQISIATVSLFARARVVSEDFGNRPGFYSLCSIFGFVAALLSGHWGSGPTKNLGSKVIAMFVFYVILTSAVNLGLLVCYARASACISDGFERRREEEKKKRALTTPEAINNSNNNNSSSNNNSGNDRELDEQFSSVKEKASIRMLFGMNGIFAAFTLCILQAATTGDSAKTIVRVGAAFIQIGAVINAITTRLVGLKNGYTCSKFEENERRRKGEIGGRDSHEIELHHARV